MLVAKVCRFLDDVRDHMKALDDYMPKGFKPLIEGKFSKGRRNPPVPTSPRPPPPLGSNGEAMQALIAETRRLIATGRDLLRQGPNPRVLECVEEMESRLR